MVNELKIVQERVDQYAPVLLLQNLPSSTDLEKWRSFITSERKKISNNLLLNVPQMDEAEGTRYIRNNQKNILILEEVLSDYQLKYEHQMPETVIEAYRFICMELDILLEEMQRFYPCYFDFSLPISYTLALTKREQLLDLHKGINHLVCDPRKDAELWNIVLRPIARFIHNLERPITFHVVRYFETLLKELSSLAIEDVMKDADCKIHSVLLNYNFNDPDYVQHYASLIAGVSGMFSKTKDRLEKVLLYRKMIRQHPRKPNLSLMPNEPTLSDQLTAWLDEEVDFYKAKLEIDAHPVPANGDGSFDPKRKVRLVMTVPELAAGVRLFYKIGKVKADSFMDLLRVVAETCTTTGSEELSVKSLQTKAYESAQDPVATENLRKFFLQCAEFLSKKVIVNK